MRDLDALFAPRSVAVLGASREPGKLGAAMAHQLASFAGPLSLINARSPDLDRGYYAGVQDIVDRTGAPPDLVIACLPASLTVDALVDAARLGCRAAVVCAGGFAEVGGAGIGLQERLVGLSAQTGMRILGPNTSGFVAPGLPLVASFVPGAERIPTGTVGVVAASGGVNHALAFALAAAGVGIELAAGLGNCADVAAADVIDHLASSPTLTCIALHVETVPDGPALLAAVARASVRVPVVALVVGKADIGDFAQSHTGALATTYAVTRAALRQAGAILVDDERDLVDAVGALSLLRLPIGSAGKVGLITGQAGPGLLIADGLRSRDVMLPELAAPSVTRLGTLLPPLTYQRNPVDTGRPGETFAQVVETVAADVDVDVVVVYGLLEPGAIDLADCLSGIDGLPVPVIAVLGGLDADLGPARATLQAAGVPALTSPAAAVRAVCALRDDALARGRAALGACAAQSGSAVPNLAASPDEWQLKQLLSGLGVAVPASVRCSDRAAARAALVELGGPVVVKVLEPVLDHKSDVGGVHLDVCTKEDLDQALTALDRMGATSYLVEAMAPPGLEILVGARRDPVFGPVVVLGLGGVTAEVMSDVAIRTLPVGPAAVADMVDELTLAPLLRGFRGSPPVDLTVLGAVVEVVGRIMCHNAHVETFEINPVRVCADGNLVALGRQHGHRRIDRHTRARGSMSSMGNGAWDLEAALDRFDTDLTGPKYDVLEPATGAVLRTVTTASTDDVAAAARAASLAGPAWAATPFTERAAVLRRAAEVLATVTDEARTWGQRETGSAFGKATHELSVGVAELQEAAALCAHPIGELLPWAEPGVSSHAQRIPVGVVGVIAPWNVPIVLALRSVAPALALGNAVVLKPDLQACVYGGAVIAAVLRAAGLPDGVLQVLPGDGSIGAAVVEDPNVDMVTFTGSTAVGRIVGREAGARLKRVVLELGGNNAIIVLPGADVERAAALGARGNFGHQGQICMATGRHLVHESLVDDYTARLVDLAAALPVGDPSLDPSVMIGPLINAKQADRVERLVAAAVDQGPVVRTGGTRSGQFFTPTVLDHVTPDMAVFSEEIFGPVAPVLAFRDVEEAIELANSTEYNLSVAIHAATSDQARPVAAAMRTGMVHINGATIADAPHIPMGGNGASGNGGRHGGHWNLDEFTTWQWTTSR